MAVLKFRKSVDGYICGYVKNSGPTFKVYMPIRIIEIEDNSERSRRLCLVRSTG